MVLRSETGAALDEVAEGFAFHRLGDEVGDPIPIANVVDGDDIRTREGAGGRDRGRIRRGESSEQRRGPDG
jgi:hypothetical protein